MNPMTNGKPYFDDYDPNKKFIQMLANPGNVEQAREFTQIQTMFMDFLNRGLSVHLRNGDVTEGGTISVEKKPDGTKVAHLSEGKVFVDGIVHPVDSADLIITGVGTEIIGIDVQDTVVTSIQDPSLLDPALGQENYLQPGADRLKREVSFALNPLDGVEVYRLVDGVPVNATEKPEFSVLNEVMARRTYEESGNYRISGMSMYSEPAKTSLGEDIPGKIALKINPGKAYVKGFEINKPVTSTVLIDQSLETRQVLSEEHTYTTGTTKYLLNNRPIKGDSPLFKVIATVEEKDQKMTKGIPGGTDYPRFTSEQITEIVKVNVGGTVYTKGTDFQLANNGIDWSPSGSEPTTGSLYTVTYQYKRLMVKGTDYNLTNLGELDFSLSGIKPVSGKPLIIDYDFYLSRIDSISVTQDGDFVIGHGQSDITRLIQPPQVDYNSVLPLAFVTLAPSSEQVVIQDISTDRLSMRDIRDMLNRVENMEYNIAIQDLEREAISGESATDLKGIFSEGFISTGRADINHPDFTGAFNLVEGRLENSQDTLVKSLTVDNVNSTIYIGANKGRLAMVPYTEEATISQVYATGKMLVNPYQVYEKRALVRLEPEVDNWVDESRVILEKETTVLKRLTPYQSRQQGLTQGTTSSVTRTSKSILDEAVTFMRQRRVDVTGSGFVPNSDNVVCLFDGKKVPLTPVTGFSAGTETGTLKVNSQGITQGYFLVPEGVRTGTKEVTLSNSLAKAVTSYTATGRKRVVEDTVLTTRTTVQWYDPLAQSFGFDQGGSRMMTSAGVYFATKDPTEPVTVQVRDMVNGLPGTVIMGEKILSPSQVKVSATGTEETKVTFDDPILLEEGTQYCVVLLTTSPLYEVFIASLSGKDLTTGKDVPSQPYNVGVLFSSSNAITWSPHHEKDLKFNIYTANYETSEKILQFLPATDFLMDAYLPLIDDLPLQGTTIQWEAKIRTIQGEDEWRPITPYVVRDIGSLATEVTIRAKLRSNGKLTPLISLDNANVLGLSTLPESAYVSKMITLTQNVTTLKQVLEVYLPSNTVMELYYKVSDTNGWTKIETSGATIEPVTNEYTRYTVTTTIPSTKTIRLKYVQKATTIPGDPNLKPVVRAKIQKFMNILK